MDKISNESRGLVVKTFSALFALLMIQGLGIMNQPAYAGGTSFSKPVASPMMSGASAPAHVQQKKASTAGTSHAGAARPPENGRAFNNTRSRPSGIHGSFSPARQPSRGGRGGADRPSNRDAANAIRNAAASRASEGRITSITPVVSGRTCVQGFGGSLSDVEFTIHGSRLGASANGRTVNLAGISRQRSLAEARVVSWSDTQIVAVVPYSNRNIHSPGRYLVGLKDGAGHWVSNINQRLAVCPSRMEVTGQITLDNCAAGRDNLRMTVAGLGTRPDRATITPVPGNDFALQYSYRRGITRNTVNLDITPELLGIRCPGGEWSPAHKALRMGFNHARATQDFHYRVPLQTFRTPMSLLASQMRRLLLGTTIHINNYRTYRSRGSNMQLSAALGGGSRNLGILPVTFGPRTYYINDINLNAIGVTPTTSGLKVTFGFEDAGMEFIGTCSDDAGCIIGAPDVQATVSVDVFLTLERYLSHGVPPSISLGTVRVVAHPHAQADGVCLAIDFMCEAFTSYQQRLKNAIESALTRELDNTRVRDLVANALRPTLAGLHIGRVNSAGVEGSDFVIRYLPAE